MLTGFRNVALIAAAVTALGCNLSRNADGLVGKFASAALYSVINRAAVAGAAQGEGHETASISQTAPATNANAPVTPAPAPFPVQRMALDNVRSLLTAATPPPPPVGASLPLIAENHESKMVFVHLRTEAGGVDIDIPRMVRLSHCIEKAAKERERLLTSSRMIDIAELRSQITAQIAIRNTPQPPEVPVSIPSLRPLTCPNHERTSS